jgi:hypothetical protein
MVLKHGTTKLIIKALVVGVILILITLSSGCIHVDIGNPFQKPEPEIADYAIVTKEGFPLKHTFNLDAGDIRYGETKPFYIKKGTEWANISIIVIINSYQIINGSPINISILEQYVKVSLRGPDDEVYYNDKFTESTEQLWPLNAPKTGRWIVAVDGQGFGTSGSNDYYEVNVVAYEPV